MLQAAFLRAKLFVGGPLMGGGWLGGGGGGGMVAVPTRGTSCRRRRAWPASRARGWSGACRPAASGARSRRRDGGRPPSSAPAPPPPA